MLINCPAAFVIMTEVLIGKELESSVERVVLLCVELQDRLTAHDGFERALITMFSRA